MRDHSGWNNKASPRLWSALTHRAGSAEIKRKRNASWAAYGALAPRTGCAPKQEQIEQARQMLSGTAPCASELGRLRSTRSEDRPRAIAGANRAGKANA